MIRIFLAVLVLKLCCLPTSGQRYFQKILGDSLTFSLLHGMSGTADGGVVLTGVWIDTPESFGYVMKLDKNGLTEWSKKPDQSGIESWFYRAHQTTDKGYILVGAENNTTPDDLLLIKLDANGDLLWTKKIGGGRHERPGVVKQTPDGGYMIAGNTGGFGAVNTDAYVVKTDKDGNTEWTKVIGENMFESFSDIVPADDGGYLLVGITQKTTMRNPDIIAVKLNNTGAVSWMYKYEYAGGDGQVNKALQTKDGGYILTGAIGTVGAYLLCLDAMGNVRWTKTYSGTSYTTAISIGQTREGGFLFMGTSGNYSYLIKTNALGDTLWTRAYGDDKIYNGIGVAQAADNSLILAGNIRGFTTNGNRIYVMKTNEKGEAPCYQKTMQITVASIMVDRLPLTLRVASGGNFIAANKSWVNQVIENKLVCASKDKARMKLGKDTVLCSGDAVMLKGETEPGSKILWSTGSTMDSISVTQTGDYWCRAILNGDTAWDTVTVTFKPRFKVYLGPDTAFCSRFSHVLDPGNKNHSYQWSTGDTTFTLRVTRPGIYSVAIRDSGTCAFGDTIAIDQVPQPVIKIEHDPACRFAVLSFSDSVKDFIWSTGETMNPIKVYASGIYSLTFRNPFCANTDTAAVELCESFYHIPNAFTPGKDDLNDVFTVYGEGIVDVHLSIYGRWGELLYAGTAWDGTYKGITCPEGVYTYMISFKGTFQGRLRKINLKGMVTLLR